MPTPQPHNNPAPATPKPAHIVKPPLGTRIRHSFATLRSFFSHNPSYLCLAIASGVIIYTVLFWLNNMDLLGYVLGTPTIPVGTKLQLLAGTFTSIWSYGVSWLLLGTLCIALLQGLLLAAMVYLVRKQRQFSKAARTAGQAGATGLLAALGLGCSACGTSIITPLVAGLGASASHTAATMIGNLATLLALVASIIALYITGRKLSMYYIETPKPQTAGSTASR